MVQRPLTPCFPGHLQGRECEACRRASFSRLFTPAGRPGVWLYALAAASMVVAASALLRLR